MDAFENSDTAKFQGPKGQGTERIELSAYFSFRFTAQIEIWLWSLDLVSKNSINRSNKLSFSYPQMQIPNACLDTD